MNIIFRVLCFILALRMTIIMVERYHENADATTVHYRRYGQRRVDMYPTFSLCFESPNFIWSNDMRLHQQYGLDPTNYASLLKGEVAIGYQYDYDSRLYFKKEVHINNGSQYRSGNFINQVSDIFYDAEYAIESGDNFVYLAGNSSESDNEILPFDIGYISPNTICFTRQSNQLWNTTREYDRFSLNRNKLMPVLDPRSKHSFGIYNETELRILIHYPGQLLRAFDTPTMKSHFSYFQWDKLLEFKLSRNTILRKRADSNDKCKDDINDYDTYVLSYIINSLGCIPPYWTELHLEHPKIDECRTKEKLKEGYHFIDHLKETLLSIEPPCQDMFISASYNWLPSDKENVAEIQFVYQDKYYEEINYEENFGFESFISNVGGFVGIFLGYSIMQFPDILSGILSLFVTFKYKISKGN